MYGYDIMLFINVLLKYQGHIQCRSSVALNDIVLNSLTIRSPLKHLHYNRNTQTGTIGMFINITHTHTSNCS